MIIEYLPIIGCVQYRTAGVAVSVGRERTYTDAITSEQRISDAAPLDGLPEIVRAAAVATRQHQPSGGKMAVYNSAQSVINYDNKIITPDHELIGLPADVSAFCNAIWNNGGRALYNAIKEIENNASEL